MKYFGIKLDGKPLHITVATSRQHGDIEYRLVQDGFAPWLVTDALADHPTVQVSEEATGQCVVGLIGIINGCCEHLTSKRVAGDFDASGNLIGFVPYTNMAEKIA